MITYQHIKLGESQLRYGLGGEIISIKQALDEYPSPSRLTLPNDAYTNDDYHLFDYNRVDELQKSGVTVYWANVYDAYLDTMTPFMVFYMEETSIIPLLIVAPLNWNTPRSKYKSEYNSSSSWKKS